MGIINWDDEFYGNCYEFAVLRDGARATIPALQVTLARRLDLMDKLKCMVQDPNSDRLAS